MYFLSIKIGCDSGLGHSLALSLNESGMHIFAGCLFPDKPGTKDLVTKAVHQDRMHVIPIDVRDELKVRTAYESVAEKLSNLPDVNLHAIVNNAGISSSGEFEWKTFDTFKQIFDVNTFGPVLVSKSFLPLIRKNEGRIINVNSIFSRLSMPGGVSYSMSKAASLSFTEGLRRELFKFGVKVISIEPAAFSTQLLFDFEQQVNKTWRTTSPEIRQAYGEESTLDLTNWYKLGRRTANTSIDSVIESVRHAILASHPRYYYVCANLPTKIFYMFGMICPQEIIEFWAETGLMISKTLTSEK